MRARLSLIPGLLLLILLPSLFAGAAGAETVQSEEDLEDYELFLFSPRLAENSPDLLDLKLTFIASRVFLDSLWDKKNYAPLARQKAEAPDIPESLRQAFIEKMDEVERLVIGDIGPLYEAGEALAEDARRTPATTFGMFARQTAFNFWDIGARRGDLRSEHASITLTFWFDEFFDSDHDRLQLTRGLLHRLAAEKDYMPSQIDLAERYDKGDGFTQDLVKAYFWYHKASTNGARLRSKLDDLQDVLEAGDLARVIGWISSERGYPDP